MIVLRAVCFCGLIIKRAAITNPRRGNMRLTSDLDSARSVHRERVARGHRGGNRPRRRCGRRCAHPHDAADAAARTGRGVKVKGDRARIIRAMSRAGRSEHDIRTELGCTRQAVASALKHEPRDAVITRLERTMTDLNERVLQLENTIAHYRSGVA